MDAEIYLVRHGETEWNAQGRFQGCLDSPLTPNGREQARQFGLLLAPGIGWISRRHDARQSSRSRM